jgi:hypothetical protein
MGMLQRYYAEKKVDKIKIAFIRNAQISMFEINFKVAF